MNEEKKNNGRGIFYGVIGVATLVVAIIGATFAYFTATGNDNGTITGNMATITFSLNVAKVTTADETKGGMIPMSNAMVQAGVDSAQGEGICLDDNDNAVCQVYKITVTNTGSASLFVDGYVNLTGGSGTATDVSGASTTMRWAQVFCTESGNVATTCTTVGGTTTGAKDGANSDTPMADWNSIGVTTTSSSTAAERHNTANILNTFADVTGTGYIAGNPYDIIDVNYIRTSQREQNATTYDRNADVESALVYNQNLAPNATQDLYIVVWLSETGTNQTASATGAGHGEAQDGTGLSFFSGEVVFNSAQGSEVTATFSGYTAVQSDKASTAQQSGSGTGN